MKKLLTVFFLFVLVINIPAQDFKNGNISLFLDGEKIEVPVRTVRLQKGDENRIIADGKIGNGNNWESVSLQFSFNYLKPQKIIAKNVALYITKKVKRIHFFVRGNNGVYSNAEKHYNITKVKINFEITKLKYEKGEIIFTGNFSGTFSAKGRYAATSGNVKIKHGKFEIIF